MAESSSQQSQANEVTTAAIRDTLVERYTNKEECMSNYKEAINDCTTYLETLQHRMAHHAEIISTRHVQMAVRRTLAGSTIGLPPEIHQNFTEWIAYTETVIIAMDAVPKHIECGHLLRDEFQKLHDIWQEFWDMEENRKEEDDDQDPELCAKLMDIADRIKYHNPRQAFLMKQFVNGREDVVALLAEAPDWIDG